MMFSLADRTVLVTGASGGIGLALVRGFVAARARVVATDMSVETLRERLTDVGDEVLPLAMDVTDVEQIERVMETVAAVFGTLDVLVNNAGIKSAEPLLSGNADVADRTVRINSTSVLLCSRIVAARFMKAEGGRIINIGSSLSSQGSVFNYQAGGADYCFSKAMVHDLTKLLAYEGAPHGINVNAIAPGIIDTPMHSRPRAETEARHAGRIPLGRVGTPADLVGLAIFLASPAADYITGQVIHVNGGMLMSG